MVVAARKPLALRLTEVHVCFVSSLSLSHIVFVLCRNILLFIVCWERRIAATHHFALNSDWEPVGAEWDHAALIRSAPASVEFYCYIGGLLVR